MTTKYRVGYRNPTTSSRTFYYRDPSVDPFTQDGTWSYSGCGPALCDSPKDALALFAEAQEYHSDRQRYLRNLIIERVEIEDDVNLEPVDLEGPFIVRAPGSISGDWFYLIGGPGTGSKDPSEATEYETVIEAAKAAAQVLGIYCGEDAEILRVTPSEQITNVERIV